MADGGVPVRTEARTPRLAGAMPPGHATVAQGSRPALPVVAGHRRRRAVWPALLPVEAIDKTNLTKALSTHDLTGLESNGLRFPR